MRNSLRLAALLALLLAGCSNSQAKRSTAGVDKDASPDVLVKNAIETRTSLSSLTGKGVMRIVDQPSRFGLTVNADVVADESDRLRIRADKLAGSIQAFDVVMLGDDIGFYIPTQKTLYHGKVGDLRNFTFNFDPDEVLRQMLRPDTALLLKRWRRSEARQGDPNNVIMVEEDLPAGRPRLRLAVNRNTGMLLSVAQLDAQGEPILIKQYDDYRSLAAVSRRSARPAEGPVFPYLISFSWPRERRMMEMHFKTVEGNAVVLDEDFDIAASADTQYLPLVEAQMDQEMLGAAPATSVASDRALAGIE